MKLDKFKLLKDDGENYHIGHPGGKTLIVAKKGLSDKAAKLVQKMASGETANKTQYMSGKDGNSMAEAVPDTEDDDDEDDKKPAPAAAAEPEAPAKKPFPGGFDSDRFYNTLSNVGTGVKDWVLGTQNGVYPQQGAPGVQTAGYTPPQQVQPAQATQAGAQLLPNAPAAPPEGSIAAAEYSTPYQQYQQPAAVQNPYAAITQGMKDANVQEARDVGAMSNAEANAWKEYNDASSQLEDPAKMLASFNRAGYDLQEKIRNGKVDPNRLFHDQGVFGKIGMALSMMLSGFGGGASHQQNMAYQVMNNAIERDIEAQRNDQSNNLNAWKLNRENLGNAMAANAATRHQLWSAVQAKVNEIGRKYQGPLSKDRANSLNAQIDAEQGQRAAIASYMQGPHDNTEMSTVNYIKGMQNLDPKRATELQARYIPDTGIAMANPVPEEKKAQIAGQKELEGVLTKAMSVEHNMGRLGAYREQNAVPAGVYNDEITTAWMKASGMRDLPQNREWVMKNVLHGGIGSFDPRLALPTTLKELLKANTNAYQSNLRAYGIQPFAKPDQSALAQEAAKQRIQRNPNDQVAQKVLYTPGGAR